MAKKIKKAVGDLCGRKKAIRRWIDVGGVGNVGSREHRSWCALKEPVVVTDLDLLSRAAFLPTRFFRSYFETRT